LVYSTTQRKAVRPSSYYHNERTKPFMESFSTEKADFV